MCICIIESHTCIHDITDWEKDCWVPQWRNEVGCWQETNPGRAWTRNICRCCETGRKRSFTGNHKQSFRSTQARYKKVNFAVSFDVYKFLSLLVVDVVFICAFLQFFILFLSSLRNANSIHECLLISNCRLNTITSLIPIILIVSVVIIFFFTLVLKKKST